MFAVNPPHSLKLDVFQAWRQLEYLGYQRGQNVYLRFFYPSTDPRKENDKGRKLDQLDRKDVEALQRTGYGVYAVVNGASGGHKDEDIKQCSAIFCEWDNRSVEDQLLHWETVGFLEPTFTVYSGDKSAHPYWVFDAPISDVEQWRELQCLLIDVMQADPSNKNPSRVFRLAGGWHVKPGRDPIRTEIVQDSGKKYSAQQLLEKLQEIRQRQLPLTKQPQIPDLEPKQENRRTSPGNRRCDSIQVPVPESVPLEMCLSKNSQQLLQAGATTGSRNASGAKLARDLIGTASYLQSIGQQFNGDPWQLFLEYCHRCPSGNGWSEGEWKNIWKSAEGDRPTPSCKADGVETCVRAWYWNNHVKPSLSKRDGTSDPTPISQGKRGGSGTGGGTPPASGTSLRDRLLEILSRNPSTSERKAAFIELDEVKGRQLQLREIEQLADALESEVDLAEGRADRAAELQSLLKIGDRRLTLTRYLHPHLAQPLEQLGEWMGVKVEALLTVLIATSASLLNPETRVIVKECIDFIEPMVFYTGIVSESGNRKSPIFKAITKPLRKLQEEEDTRHKLAQERYKADLQQWKQNKSDNKGEQPEPPPPPREYFVDNITSEALDRIKAQQPGHGILIRKDELSGLFGSYGAYKGGRGSDKEGILSGWNGDGVKQNRAGGSRLSLSHDASSIAGAIQPGKLCGIMGDLEDEQGEWGRFLWCLLDLIAHQLPDDDTKFEVGELLEGIYRKLDKLPPVQYRFTPDAQRAYQNWHWELEQRKLAEPRQGMRAAIAKMEGYTARLAGILHILWAIAAGEAPDPYIPIERVKAAKKLAEFYLGQVQLIHSYARANQGELTPSLKAILEKAKQLGELSTRKAPSAIRSLRNFKAGKILEFFKELEAMGHGKVDKKTFIPKTLVSTVSNVSTFAKDQVQQGVDNASAVSATPSATSPEPSATLVDSADKFADANADTLAMAETLDTRTLPLLLNENADVMLTNADANADTQKGLETITITSLQPLEDKNADVADAFSDQNSTQNKKSLSKGDRVVQVPEVPVAPVVADMPLAAPAVALVLDVLEPPIAVEVPLEVGDRVVWDNCPGHCSWMNPFTITATDGDMARLDFYSELVPLSELTRCLSQP